MVSFKLKNKLDFNRDFHYDIVLNTPPEFKEFVKEIQKRIPVYLDYYADEWEASKNTDSITMTITKTALKELINECGSNYWKGGDEIVKVKIIAYDERDDDGDNDDLEEEDKQIYFEIEDEAEIPTFYLKDQNEMVGSLYYFIKHF